MRVDLAVPYSDRRAARRLGACWDAAARVWYVPDNRDPSRFALWLPASGHVNVRAPSFWIAQAARACWSCGRSSAIFGFALPETHQTLWLGERRWEQIWERAEAPTFVCYLEYLLPPVAERMRERAPNYRFAFRRRTQSYYWVNHCEHCGSKLGDYETFCEPGQGFHPVTRADAAQILLTPVDLPFAAIAGGWELGHELFGSMSHCAAASG